MLMLNLISYNIIFLNLKIKLMKLIYSKLEKKSSKPSCTLNICPECQNKILVHLSG